MSPEMIEKLDLIKRKFHELDANGDGFLSFEELESLLRKGNPDLDESEIRLIYDEMDEHKDGKVDFHEFCDYVFREEEDDDEEEGEEDRMSFRLEQEDKQAEYHRKTAAEKSDSDSEPETWERMQISKAINNQQVIHLLSLNYVIDLQCIINN